MMNNNHFDEAWNGIKETWNRSARAEEINLEVSVLIAELKSKVSPFEKQSIKDDIELIKRNTSQFEKDSIDRDLQLISKSLKKFMELFKK
jgi:hypothetical protein